jgi:pimeloyl-ACP methyl ester carboxylesterase
MTQSGPASSVGAAPRKAARSSGCLKAIIIAAAIPIGLILAGIIYQAVASSVDAGRFPPPGRMVDVGGYNMHMYCIGENVQGSPTIVLDASYPATVSSWVWIQPQLAVETRVCSYDRAGEGWSDPSPAEPTMQSMASELHALLENSGETGPYILVGHSWGGAVTRLFAHQFPEEVSALVWIEATHPDTWIRQGEVETTLGGISPEMIAGIPSLTSVGLFRLVPSLRGDWGIVPGLPPQQQGELTAYFNTRKWADHIVAVEKALPESLTQLRSADDLGDVPLFIIVGGASNNETAMELQRELGALSSNSREFVVDGADHSSLVHEEEFARQTGEIILQMLVLLQDEN